MFSIAPYSIQILDEDHQAVDLWKFNNSNNLRQVLIDYYLNETSTYTEISRNSLFRVAKLLKANSISVAGQYETGEHGFKSTLYDVAKKKVSHLKTKTEADMLPFQFLFILPKSDLKASRKTGILLLARHKIFGIRTITIPHLKAHIEARFPQHQFIINRIYPAALAKSILEMGKLKSIRLIKYRMPNALEDLLDADDLSQMQEIEIVVKAKNKSSFFSKETFMNLLEGRGNYRQVYSSIDLACDNIKLDVEIGGRTRRINIGKRLVSSDVDITEDVEVDESGFPTLKSWFEQADQLGISLLENMNIKAEINTSTDDYQS